MPRLALLLTLLTAPGAFAQPAATPPAATQSVTFARRPATTGETLTQTMRVGVSLEQSARRGAEVVEQAQRTTDRQQTRRLVVTEVEGGRAVAASVGFPTSTTETDRGAEADPIQGKAYAVRRDGENLVITTPDGQTPPLAQYELVAKALATFGKPNPLAEYLAGRTVRVGQRLELPADVAGRAFGFDKSLGAVESFALTLTAIEKGVARFDAQVEATGLGGQQMRLSVGGAFALEAASCRVVSATLAGPLAMSTKVGDLTVDARGKMRLEITSRYE